MTITERIDSVTTIDPAYRKAICPPPKSVKIELTSACNYRCTFCVRSVRADGKSEHMDRKLYSRIIREIRDAGVPELGLFYIGESFSCPWLAEAIAEAKDVGFEYVFLTTNGALATSVRLRACFEAGLNSLKFSLNFSDADQLSDIARVSARNFERVLHNIRMARGLRDAGGYACRLYASSIRFDGEQGERMQALVDQVRPFVDEHYWLPLYGMGGASEAAGWSPHPGNPGRIGAMRKPIPCWAVFTAGHVTVDGKLSACCFGAGDQDDLIMADLRKVDFLLGWNSERYRALRTAHLDGDVTDSACAGCAGIATS